MHQYLDVVVVDVLVYLRRVSSVSISGIALMESLGGAVVVLARGSGLRMSGSTFCQGMVSRL